MSAPRPRRPADAPWMLAEAADALLVAEAVAEEAAAATEEDADARTEDTDEPTLPVAEEAAVETPTTLPVVRDASELTAPPMMTVVELPALTTKSVTEEEMLRVMVLTPERPAGMVATAGWLVTTVGRAD